MEKEFNFNNKLSGEAAGRYNRKNKPGMHDENLHFLFQEVYR